jgi:hypothetical protein
MGWVLLLCYWYGVVAGNISEDVNRIGKELTALRETLKRRACAALESPSASIPSQLKMLESLGDQEGTPARCECHGFDAKKKLEYLPWQKWLLNLKADIEENPDKFGPVKRLFTLALQMHYV